MTCKFSHIFCLGVILLSACGSSSKIPAPSRQTSIENQIKRGPEPKIIHTRANMDDEETLFQLGLAMMLTENTEEATMCFQELRRRGRSSVEVLNNLGVAQVKHALSLLKPEEAESIRWVFPFEVSPNQGVKGVGDAEKARLKLITRLLISSVGVFEEITQQHDQFASGYLNLASARLLLMKWQNNLQDYVDILDILDTAEQLAQSQSLQNTLGHIQIVKGILFDYFGKDVQRDEYFYLASNNSNVRVQGLVGRNQAIKGGGEPEYINVSGEKFDLFTDERETIDGISIPRLLNSINLSPDREITALDQAKLFQKDYATSSLYIFYESERKFFFFQKTGENYQGESSKAVSIGSTEGQVRKAYGRPYRIQEAEGGSYFYYRKAKAIFFLDSNHRVRHWWVWGAKR